MQDQTVNALEFRGITKTFPGVIALDNVSFSIRPGEVHGLVGENGAGKSTLIKILCGVYTADEGDISIAGKTVHISNAADARDNGVQVMHQEISVLPNMSVAENIYSYSIPRKCRVFVDDKTMNERASDVLKLVGLEDIDPNQLLGGLSLATQQMINLARIVSTNPKIVLLDEPTASLTMNEAERLFEVIRRYKESGVSIVYISHYLDEVLRICDRVTVLRDGKYISTCEARNTSKEDIVYAMIGKTLKASQHVCEASDGRVMTMKNATAHHVIKNVNIDLREKEVLGLYGLNGAGKTELLRAIMGLNKLHEGEITLFDTSIVGRPIDQITRLGMVYIPEDRRRQGLVMPMNITQNCTLGNEEKYARASIMNARAELDDAIRYTGMMHVKTPSMDTRISTLSGGNQQKVIMARCISRDARVYLLDEPTVGIDVGAREEIYELIAKIVKEGSSVLLASSDITEILENCDRIAVIAHGTIVRVLDRSDATEEKLLLYAMGGADDDCDKKGA